METAVPVSLSSNVYKRGARFGHAELYRTLGDRWESYIGDAWDVGDVKLVGWG
jgi:hypothetical protein